MFSERTILSFYILLQIPYCRYEEERTHILEKILLDIQSTSTEIDQLLDLMKSDTSMVHEIIDDAESTDGQSQLLQTQTPPNQEPKPNTQNSMKEIDQLLNLMKSDASSIHELGDDAESIAAQSQLLQPEIRPNQKPIPNTKNSKKGIDQLLNLVKSDTSSMHELKDDAERGAPSAMKYSELQK